MMDILINFFAFLGAAVYVVVPLIFSQGQTPLFPLPGLYFLEIALGGLVTMWLIQVRRFPLAPWIAGGVLLAFVVLAGFSIGFYLVPAMLAFTAAAALRHGRPDQAMLRAFGVLLIAATGQGLLMLALVMFS